MNTADFGDKDAKAVSYGISLKAKLYGLGWRMKSLSMDTSKRRYLTLDDGAATHNCLKFGTGDDFALFFDATNLVLAGASERVGLFTITNCEMRIGAQANATGSGVPLSSTYTAAFRVLVDDDDTASTTGSVPDIAGIKSRYLHTSVSSNDLRHYGTMGQIKAYDGDWDSEQVAGAYGYVELVNVSTTISLGGYGVTAGLMGCVETVKTVTVGTNHVLAGVAAISKLDTGATGTFTNDGTTAGLYVGIYDITNWSSDAAVTAWEYGLCIDTSAATTGIYLGTATTGISMAGTMTDGINFAGTYTGNVIDFSSATINPTGSGGPCFIRVGAYGTEVDYGADNDQSGVIRTYTTCSGDISSYDRGIFACTVTTGAKGAYPIAGLAEANNTGTGPKALGAGQFIAHLGARSSGAHLTTLGAGAAQLCGMYGIWAKVAAAGTAVCDSGSRIAPIWCDSQMSGTVTGDEYGIFSTTGASKPGAWAGFSTSSTGYSQFLYFDSTFNSGAGTCVTSDAVPGGNQTARILVSYDGTQYYIALYR